MTPTAMPPFAPPESPNPVDGTEGGVEAAAPLALLPDDTAIGVQFCSQLVAKSEIGFDLMVSSVGWMG